MLFPITNRTFLAITMTFVVIVTGCRATNRTSMRALESSQEYYARADAAMREGNQDEAQQYVQQALQKNPGSDDSRVLYAKILWEKGQKQEAIETLLPAVNRTDASAEVLLTISRMYLEIGDLNNARYTIGKCVMKYPSNPDIWRVRAAYFEQRENPEQAWADLHHSLSLDPNQHEVRLQLARLYLQNGQPQRALESAHYVLSKVSTDEEPLQAVIIEGEAFYALERYAQAEDSFMTASSRDPSNADVYFYLASTRQQQGKYNEALAAANEGLKRKPEHAGCRDVVNMIQTAQQGGFGVR